jgi:sugar lactone lactonase YvrE
MEYKLLLITLGIFSLGFLPGCANLDKPATNIVNNSRNLIPFVQFDLENEKKWGYLDEDTGEIVIEAKYVRATPFTGNYAMVIKNWQDSRQLIIDKNEKVITSISPFAMVHFIASENGKNTVALIRTEHKRKKFHFGWFLIPWMVSEEEDYDRYRFINLETGGTTLPRNNNYVMGGIEVVGDYLIVGTDLYQFMDNGAVKFLVKDNPERTAGILKDYLEGRGINAHIEANFFSVEIDYSPYIKTRYADPDLSGAFQTLPPEFSIPFTKAEPFLREPKDLLNAPLEITERKYVLHFLNKKTHEYAMGIYNESKAEWELLPSLTAPNRGREELFYVVDILPTNNPHLYCLHLKNDYIGWENRNRYGVIGDGIYSVIEKKFLINLKLVDNSPSITPPGGNRRRIRFPDGGVYYWDDERIRFSPFSHSSAIWAVAFSPDGKSVISGSRDSKIKLWSAESGDLLKTFLPQRSAISVAFSPDGNIIATGSESGKITLLDVASTDIIRVIEGHADWVRALSFSPDGNTIVSASEDKMVRLWDTASGSRIKTFSGHSDEVNSVAFSPDGKTIISGSDDTTIKLWDVASGNLLRTFNGHSQSVKSVAFSPDGKTFVSGSNDNTVKLWDISKKQVIRTFSHSDIVLSVTFSPDGNTIASGSYDNSIKIWDAKSGRLVRTISGGLNLLLSIAFSPDGKTIVFGGHNKTVKLWSAESGELIRTFIDRGL